MAKQAKAANGKAPSRRKKAETADETVEQSSGVQLLLGNLPPDKDAVFHFESILGWMAKAATAQGKVREAKKRAKEAGIDVGALMQVMKFERADPLDVAAQLKEMARLGRLRGLPVQIQLFEPKFGSVEEQAKAEGLAAGRNGRTPDTARWPDGSPGFDAYMAAHLEGQKGIIEGASA